MASGSEGAQGGNWQTVCQEKGENKRMALSERPEMSGDEGNKMRRTGVNDEFVVLFKVKGANQGDPGLKQRVFLGSMAYQVREYIIPPLRCYNCQRFGHEAGSCRGKRKCAICGGDHVIQKCEAEAPKCPNCGGDHAAAFRG